MSSPRLARVLRRASGALVLLVPLLAGSCQGIVGIDDRELGPCGHFCDVVMANCTGDNQVYESRKHCLGFCQLLPPGDAVEPQGKDTVACRLLEANRAKTDGDTEATNDHCRSAGPEGLACGGGCDAYCTVYEKACENVQCGSLANCVAKCKGLRDNGEFSLQDDFNGNSLQCRLIHLTNSTLEPDTHCSHAALQQPSAHCIDTDPSEDGAGGQADATPSSPQHPDQPNCDDYCRVTMTACGLTQYESLKQCQAVCKYFPVGHFADTDQNTLGCRIYHGFNALCGADFHCPHAGPGGEGHCGTDPTEKCHAYCTLAAGICPHEYGSEFKNDDDCAAKCSELEDAVPTDDGPTRYDTTYAETPGTLACRFLALSRAAVDDKLCSDLSAFGKGDCAAP